MPASDEEPRKLTPAMMPHPRPGEPYSIVPLVQCEKCNVLHEAEPECCACLDGIDDWDGAAAHYCGRCASRMKPADRQEERILDLERKLSRVLDAAMEMDMRCPETVAITLHGWCERWEQVCEAAYEPAAMTMTWRAQEVDNATRASVTHALYHEVRRRGDWSTLQEREEEVKLLNDLLHEQRRRTELLLDFVEGVVDKESKVPDPFGAAGSPCDAHSWNEQRAAYRVGGREALSEVLYQPKATADG